MSNKMNKKYNLRIISLYLNTNCLLSIHFQTFPPEKLDRSHFGPSVQSFPLKFFRLTFLLNPTSCGTLHRFRKRPKHLDRQPGRDVSEVLIPFVTS